LGQFSVRRTGKALKNFGGYEHDGGPESLRKRLYTVRADARAKLSPGDWALVTRLHSLATPYRYDDAIEATAREPDFTVKLREYGAGLANELECIKRELVGRRQIEGLSAVRRMLDAAEENARALAELAAKIERDDDGESWTDEELTSLLEDMWRRGCTSSEIAFHLAVRCTRAVNCAKCQN